MNRSRNGESMNTDCQKVERCGLSGENGKFETLLVAEKRAKMTDFVLKGLANGTLKPVIDKTFRLDNVVEAHRYLESNQHVGKVVVTVGAQYRG